MIEKEELELFEHRWREIDQKGFIKVLQISKSQSKPTNYHIDQKEFMVIYSKVYDILMTKNNEIRKLCYQRLLSTLKYHCEDLLNSIRSETLAMDFSDRWNAYTAIVTTWIMKTFSYMKRIKLLAPKNSSLEEEIKSIFKQEVYDKKALSLKESFIQYISQSRIGNDLQVNYTLMKAFIDFLLYFKENDSESLFMLEYEKVIVNNMKSHYKTLISQETHRSYVEYLHSSLLLLQKEESNSKKYLPEDTVQVISDNLYYLFFFEEAKLLLDLDDGFISLLEKQDYDSLKKTFMIFSKNENTLSLILSLFKQFITKQFENLIEKYSNFSGGPKEIGTKSNFIQDYSSFQLFIINLITSCFGNNNLFNVAFKEILEGIQSKNENYSISYVLPFYYDKYLRRSYGQSNGATTTNAVIDQSIFLFPFVYEKDVFITIHRSLLSARLLTDDLVSMDSEKYLIGKLKSQCGEVYTSNAETMVSDYFLNKEITHKYKQWLDDSDNSQVSKLIPSKVHSTYIVLTAEHWPALNISKLRLPEELIIMTNQFFKFYHLSNAGRTLQWALFDSTIEIDGHYKGMVYSFTMNTVQGLVLLSFNKTNGYKHLRDHLFQVLGFEKDADFDRAIVPLIQCKLLLESYGNNEWLYELNREFKTSTKRVKIQLGTKVEEIIKKEKIEDDRSMAIDGTIVRLMKAHQKLSHNELLKLVLDHLDKFKVQIATIKKRIDGLIEKEMMIRDKDDPNVYLYFGNNN